MERAIFGTTRGSRSTASPGRRFHATFGERYFVSAAWSIQVWGAVPGGSGMLDLINFERHQAKLRLGVSF